MHNLFLALLLLIAPFSKTNDNLLLTHEDKTLATVNRAAYYSPIFGDSVIDMTTFQGLMEKVKLEVYNPPRNAFINDSGEIKPGEDGYALNQLAFKKQFYTYYFGRGSAKMNVPLIPIHPKVDSELLAEIRVKQIGSYVTYFNQRNHERSHNISLASEAINNAVVFPGEIFSFNEVVGERTLEKGYLPAPVIVKGELYEGIGGGICQVSSTLFNAVDRAGVEMIQRYSHSRRVPYVPPGRDATVSWYGPDFTFKNIHNQPILIKAKTIKGQVVIHIFSSDVVNFEPRNVPNAPQRLPKEIKINL
ncbi:VanW family protein [Evansella sp. AB-rgal1]|uniref:VanW family protein n=1 Tax=Evansella sp. AB-rgal1 TaxID=3242696 RepID=UPI00359CEC51